MSDVKNMSLFSKNSGPEVAEIKHFIALDGESTVYENDSGNILSYEEVLDYLVTVREKYSVKVRKFAELPISHQRVIGAILGTTYKEEYGARIFINSANY